MEDEHQVSRQPLWIYLAAVFMFALLVTLGVVVYYLFFHGPPDSERWQPPAELVGPIQVENEEEEVGKVESDLDTMESELTDLDEIDEELKTPDIDLDLGL